MNPDPPDPVNNNGLVSMSSTTVVKSATNEKLEEALGDLWGRLESVESRRAYKKDWRLYCVWLDSVGISPSDATVATVQKYVNQLRDEGKAKSTRARALSVLREVYRALVVGEVCIRNPAREVKNPKVDSDPKTPWLDENRLATLFTATVEDWKSRRDRLVLLALAMLGWRRSEIARMKVEDFTGNVIKQTVKRNKQRSVGVPEYLIKEIDAWRKYANINTGPIFLRAEDNRVAMSGKMVYSTVRRIGVSAGLGNISPHALRRTYITILEGRGVSLRDLQSAVSHESVTTTERYSKAAAAARQAPGQLLVDLVSGNKSSKSEPKNG